MSGESWARKHARERGHQTREALDDPGSCADCTERSPMYRVEYINQGGEDAPVLPGDTVRVHLDSGPVDFVVGDVEFDGPGWRVTPKTPESPDQPQG